MNGAFIELHLRFFKTKQRQIFLISSSVQAYILLSLELFFHHVPTNAVLFVLRHKIEKSPHRVG